MPGGALVRRFVGHSNVVMMCVTFSPDGRLLATGDVDKTARIWDVASGECLRTLAGHTRQVSGVAFSPDGQTLATSSEDYSIKLWDWAAGEVRWTLEGHTAWVYRVAFSPDGRWLASVSDDMTVRLWDVARGKEASIFRGHEGRYVRGVAFSPDGRFLATTSGAPTSAPGANTVKVWDLTSVPQVYRALDPRTRERVRSVAFSADGRRLASAGRDRAVRLWDVFSGRQTHVLTGHTAEVLGVAIGSRDKLLASCGYDGTVRLWDADSGRLVRTLTDHRGPVTAVAFSPDGRQLAAAGEDRTVIVWEAESGRLVHTLAGHREAVVNIAFSPDGRRLASASNDRTVKLWDTETGEELQTLQGFTQKWRPLAFSPDGSQLATAGSGGTDAVQLWDTASGKSIRNLAGLWGGIYAVAFSPDGRRVVAGGPDAKVKVWDTASGQEVLTLQVPSGEISCVAFSPDGRWLAAAGAKSPPIQLWEAPPESRTEPEDRAALLTPEYVLRWHLDAAEDCLQAGQRPAARWHVDRLGHPALTDPLLYARLAGIRAKFGLWAEVIADAEAALRQQPDNADARCLRGLACQKLGHHADAVADFSALLTRHPCSAQLYELRAASHEALGQGDLARADREQAIKLGGKNPMVLNNEAWRLVAGPAGQRDPAKALDLIQQALKLAPDSATFLNTLGVVQYRNGQYKEAVNTLEKSRAAGQGRHDAFDLFFLAMCHARLGDAAKAKDCFDRAVRWTEAQKNLPAQHAEELKAFRAEAEGVLHRK